MSGRRAALTAMEDDLWRVVDGALSHHRKPHAGDRIGLDVLNRLFREHAMRAQLKNPPIHGPGNCSIRRERWTTQELAARVIPWHQRAKPQHKGGPLITVEHEAKLYLIDGANRLHYWVCQGDDTEHEVIIIRSR